MNRTEEIVSEVQYLKSETHKKATLNIAYNTEKGNIKHNMQQPELINITA